MSTKDVVILLLGKTGSGKSSFVNTAGGDPLADVANNGEDLRARTQCIQAHRLTRQEHNILLVDTPGFDQTEQMNPSIMKQIQEHVKDLNPETARFCTVLMFIPLNEDIQISSTKMFSQIANDRTAFVTVGGYDVPPEKAKEREETLKRKLALPPRAVIAHRFDFTADSASSILDEVLNKHMVELQELKGAIQSVDRSSTPRPSRLLCC